MTRFAVVAWAIFFTLASAMAESAFLNYSTVLPGFPLFSGCAPVAFSGGNCSTSKNYFKVLTTGSSCSFVTASNYYQYKEPSFSFSLSRVSDAIIFFSIDKCKTTSDGLKLSVNGKCDVNVSNGCYGSCNKGQVIANASIPSRCFVQGSNSIKISGKISLGSSAIIALGNGSCPTLSCHSAPVYAQLSFLPSNANLSASGEFNFSEDTVSYSFPLNGSGPVSARIPAEAENVSASSANATLSCPSAECAFENGLLSFNSSGPSTLSYSVPRISLSASFTDGHGNAYFPNEKANLQLSAQANGAPVQGLLVRLGNASCTTTAAGTCAVQLSLASLPLGRNTFSISAVKNQAGSRGADSITLVTEANTTQVDRTEELVETMLTVYFRVSNNKRTPFNSSLLTPIPGDFVGGGGAWSDLLSLPIWIENNIISLNASCAPYQNCSFLVRFKIKGITAELENVTPANETRVGEKLSAILQIRMRNTNPIRAIRQSFNDRNFSQWQLGATLGTADLGPNMTSLIEVTGLLDSTAECANASASSPNSYTRKITACIRVLENEHTPKAKIAYRLSKDLFINWSKKINSTVKFTADNSATDLSWTEDNDSVTLVVGANHTNSSLHLGDHQLIFSYELPHSSTGGGSGGGGSGGSGGSNGSGSGGGSSSGGSSSGGSSSGGGSTSGASYNVIPANYSFNASSNSTSNSTNESATNQSANDSAIQPVTPPEPPKIEILLPGQIKSGDLVSIVVFSDSQPAKGMLRISSPTGMEYPRMLSNGRVEFSFSEPGQWEVGFGNYSVKADVANVSSVVSIPGIPFYSGSIANAMQFKFFDYAWLLAAAFLLPLPFIAFLLYSLFFRQSPGGFSKTVSGEDVKIVVESNPELWNAAILDLAGDAQIIDAGGAEVSETVFGKVLKWQKPLMRANEGWAVSYKAIGIKSPRQSELTGMGGKGKVKLKSSVDFSPGAQAPAG